MANASYTSASRVTSAAARDVAYDRIILVLAHLKALNINLVSIVVNADHSITLTIDQALAQEQVDHLGVLL